MSAAQLSGRLGITRQAVADLERRELEDAVTLGALRKAAAAMECDLVYAIVPRSSLAQTMEDQALARATAEVSRAAHARRLENREIGKAETERLIEERFAALLSKDRKQLWGDPMRANLTGHGARA
jgi:predicted DNA-binding mobile mystery protein A